MRARKKKQQNTTDIVQIKKAMVEFGKWWLELDRRLEKVEKDTFELKVRSLDSVDDIRYKILKNQYRNTIKELKKLKIICNALEFLVMVLLFTTFVLGGM